MRILGIDYGKKRIGLAISDESQTFARELKILSPKDFFKNILNLIKEEEVGKIVLGWPLNMTGKETDKTREVGKFKQRLEELVKVKVDIMDERLSTSMAKNLPGGATDRDSLAAQIILQNYLNRQKSNF